jgi:hypothetical protein
MVEPFLPVSGRKRQNAALLNEVRPADKNGGSRSAIKVLKRRQPTLLGSHSGAPELEDLSQPRRKQVDQFVLR